jgi:hypothetical protein
MIGAVVLLWPWLHRARFLVLYAKPKFGSGKLNHTAHNPTSDHFLSERSDIRKKLQILIPLASVYVIIVVAGFLILRVGIAGYYPNPARFAAFSTPEEWVYQVSLISVVLSYVAFLFMYFQAWRQLNIKKIYRLVEAAHLKKYVARIVGILPTEARAGSTHTLLLDVDLSPEFENLCAGQHLEVEIQAAGIPIDGERRVQLCSSSPLPPAVWSCCFSSVGEQTINLRASVITPSGRQDETREVIFQHQHQIHVKSLVSASWLPVFTIALSALSTLAALLQHVA